MQGARLKYNGAYLDETIIGYETLNVEGRGLFAPEIDTIDIKGRDGSIIVGQHNPAREIVVEYAMKAKNNPNWLEQMRMLYNALATTKDVAFSFGDEYGTRYGRLSDFSDPDVDSNQGVGTFTIYCQDPYIYGRKRKIAGDTAIKTKHSIKIDKITVKVKEKCSSLVIRNTNTGKRIKLVNDFQPNDTIVIEGEKITINNELKPTALDAMHSDYYSFQIAHNEIISALPHSLEIEYREKWL